MPILSKKPASQSKPINERIIKMKSYTIKKTDDITKAPFEYVDSYPWDYDYKPKACFRLTHNDEGIIICMRVYEKDPVAHATKRNDYTCNDSCIEFFFSPSPDSSNGYFSLEVNANPTFLLEYKSSVESSPVKVECPDEALRMTSTKTKDENGEDYWQIDAFFPYWVVKKYVPDCDLSSGATIRGNINKCGCDDQPDHYGTWSPVDTPTPCFHCPDKFGILYLE